MKMNLCRTSLEDAGGFSRDAFGRQSMSEKRHATLDAKSTDTYQRNKKVRDERERQKHQDPEEIRSDKLRQRLAEERNLQGMFFKFNGFNCSLVYFVVFI